MEPRVLKPNKTAFIIYGSLKAIVGFIILLGIMAVSTSLFLIPVFAIIIGLTLLPIIFWNISRYNKEEYHIYSNKLIHKRGTWFSDNITELVIKNITHVDYVLPWLENKFFGTGNLVVQAAGSSNAEIKFVNVDAPNSLYEEFEVLLKNNGFQLTKKNLVMKEKPHPLAVLFEVFGKILIGIFFISYAFGEEIAAGNSFLTALSTIIVIAIIAFIKLFFVWMNLIKRTYYIYDDTFMFEEGWMTKKYSFFPVENLTDTKLTQTLVDKIFGLYDVALSSPGGGKEIKFKNLKNGFVMKEKIDEIIKHKREAPEQKTTARAAHATNKTIDTHTEKDLFMDGKKSFAPLWIGFVIALMFPIISIIVYAIYGSTWQVISTLVALGIILLFHLLALLVTSIRVKNTKFSIKQNYMESEFNFIFHHDIEFSNDHITGLFFRESFIDRWFNTFTTNFWSIGSSTALKFDNIKKTEGLQELILKKVGINPKKPLQTIKPEFSFSKLLIKGFIGWIFYLIILVTFLGLSYFLPYVFIPLAIAQILITVGVLWYTSVFYKRALLEIHPGFVHYKEGILFVKHYYATHDNIKDLKSMKYPFIDFGSLTFNVAGDSVGAPQERKGRAGRGNQISRSHGFSIKYLPKVLEMHDWYDGFSMQQVSNLQRLKPLNTKLKAEGKPALANNLVPTILIGVLFLPLAIPAIIAIPFIIYYIKHSYYHIEEDRSVKFTKLIFTHKTSVLHSKIDHISVSRGLLNKMFSNGSVTINTRGSSTPEIVFSNSDNYSELQQIIRKEYEEARQ